MMPETRYFRICDARLLKHANMKRCPVCTRQLYYAGTFCMICRRIVWGFPTIAIACLLTALLVAGLSYWA